MKSSLYEIEGLKEEFIAKYGKDLGETNFALAEALYKVGAKSARVDVSDDGCPYIAEIYQDPVIEAIIKQYPEVADFIKSFCGDFGIVPERFRGLYNAQEAGLSVKEHELYLTTGKTRKLVKRFLTK